MKPREIRRRCEAIARALYVPDPFDLDVFLDALAEQRGRPIKLLSLDLPTTAPCGLCIATDTTDYIAVTTAATGRQRDHIALHEIGHLLLGHQIKISGAGIPDLFRHIDAGVIERVFARTTYSTIAEQEAETLASLLGQRTSALRPVRSSSDDPLIGRLERSLEHGTGGHG